VTPSRAATVKATDTSAPAAGPKKLALAPAPARPQAQPIVRAPRPARPLPVTEKILPEVRARQAALTPTVADLAASRVRTTRPEAPAVQPGAAGAAEKAAAAAAPAGPGGAEVAAPSTKMMGKSLVAASAPGASHVSRKMAEVAPTTEARQQGPPIKMPATVGRPAEAVEKRPTATGLQAAGALQRRLADAGPKRGPAEPLRTDTGLNPTERAGESLVGLLAARTPRPTPADAAASVIAPKTPLIPLSAPLSPGGLKAAPQPLFHRGPEQKEPLLKHMGGSKETEDSVRRALVYLAANQEPDGRWTRFTGGRPRRRQGRDKADVALTGLSALCFLASNHTPTNAASDYRQTVSRALKFLMDHQKPSGDLRAGGQMYGHGIATLALGEAAAMTNDPAYRLAAIKGARFILKAQHPRTGGWRYAPGDTGDTSVFGWQVMALHSVERLGMKIPQKTRLGALGWLNRVSRSKHKMLCGYTDPSPKPAMTAEGVFSYMLLGKRLTKPQLNEASGYLLQNPPGKGGSNFYYWYYASLALMQMQNEAWKKWNVRMSTHLRKLQRTGGILDGSWDTGSTYGPRGGRIYTTAMATLTLEVYYRYLPMYGQPIHR